MDDLQVVLERRIALSELGGLLLDVRERRPWGPARAFDWYSGALRVLTAEGEAGSAVLAHIDGLLDQVPEWCVTRAVQGRTTAETAAAVELRAQPQADSASLGGVDLELDMHVRRLLQQRLEQHGGLLAGEAARLVSTTHAVARPTRAPRWLLLQQASPGALNLLSFSPYPASWRSDDQALIGVVNQAARLLLRPGPPSAGGGQPARPPTPRPLGPTGPTSIAEPTGDR